MNNLYGPKGLFVYSSLLFVTFPGILHSVIALGVIYGILNPLRRVYACLPQVASARIAVRKLVV